MRMMKWLLLDCVCEISQYETIERLVSHPSWGVLSRTICAFTKAVTPINEHLGTRHIASSKGFRVVTVWVAGVCTLDEII